MIIALSVIGIVFALLPAISFLNNLSLFAFTDNVAGSPTIEKVSILIPARNEAASIAASVTAALASQSVDVDVVVLDDHSSDRTGDIVRQLAAAHAGVRYLVSDPLPSGWNGKQHACYQLVQQARFQRIVFVDADVRLQPDAIQRLIRYQEARQVALLSAFPHQQTGTWLEKWIVPLMHFVLLGYLPFSRMRASAHPAYAAGCGQLFMTTKDAYHQAGTHAAIRQSRHDGLKLPRAFRAAGLTTDVVDGTELAECRMYHSAGEVVQGVLKNALEGIANPKLIWLFTILLLGGSVLPAITLIWSIAASHLMGSILSVTGVIIGHAPRAIAAVRFRQPLAGVLCHSLSVTIFIALQWIALLNHVRGRQVAWRGRTET
jgi:Glycosyltransferase like family 2